MFSFFQFCWPYRIPFQKRFPSTIKGAQAANASANMSVCMAGMPFPMSSQTKVQLVLSSQSVWLWLEPKCTYRRLLAKARMLARPLGQNILMGQDVGSWAMAMAMPMARGHGPWAMAHGPWPMAMAHGPWAMGHGAWPMAHGPWPMAMAHV